METSIRTVVPDDHVRLVRLAAEGDFSDCDSRYFSFEGVELTPTLAALHPGLA